MKSVFFIGIGGIGLSALARFLHEQGYTVSGSDLRESELICELRAEGIAVFVGHFASNLAADVDLVIYSAAISADNPERARARELGISCLSRKEALPLILGSKRLLAVAGAHGKSTTSAMLANIAQSGFIIGAVDKKSGKNMLYKKAGELVFEADESDSSFLNIRPYIGVVTNAEPEHMEHYGHDLERFYGAYERFLNQCKKRVINAEDEFLARFNGEAVRLWPSRDIKDLRFEVLGGLPFVNFELCSYGRFSVQGHSKCSAIDAALAVLAARELGLSFSEIKANLREFAGIKKRFDVLISRENYVLIDDYGHHPTEIAETKKGLFAYASALGIARTVALWQPHKYTRTRDNLEGFVRAFEGFSELVILPVYAAGQAEIALDLPAHFPAAFFAQVLRRLEDGSLELVAASGERKVLSSGLVCGFNAGDLTYKLRGQNA